MSHQTEFMFLPRLLILRDDLPKVEDDWQLECPVCGNVDTLDGYDTIDPTPDADPHYMFCQCCHECLRQPERGIMEAFRAYVQKRDKPE